MSFTPKEIPAGSITWRLLSTGVKNAIKGANRNSYIAVPNPAEPAETTYTGTTTDATETEIYLQGTVGQYFALEPSSLYFIHITCLAHNTTDNDGYLSQITALLRTDASSNATFIQDAITKITNFEGSMNDISVDLSENAGGFVVKVTGLAAKTINWKLLTKFEVL